MTRNSQSRRLLLILATLVVLVGGALRIWASFSAFWLDEILTLNWPQRLGYWDLLTKARHDNNHVLNSMFLRFVGDPDHWVCYRALAFVTGTVAAACMACIAWRRSPVEGLIAAVLGSWTFVLIHYSSEARGYGPLCCFALLSFMTIDRARRSPGWSVAALFWLWAILGVLSHSTYAFAYIGLAAWSGILWFPNKRAPAIELLRMHLVPVAVLATVSFGRIQGMAIGGGPEFDLLRVIINALSHCVGWRYGDWRGDSLAALVILLAALEVVWRVRDREAEKTWVFYGALLVVTPLLVVFILKPSIIYMRYLLVCVPFILLLLASLLGRLWRCCKWGRAAAVVLVGLLVCVNGFRIQALLKGGRGRYLQALNYISERDPSTTIRVTGNNRLHVGKVIEFYNKYLDRKVVYVNKEDVKQAPRWFIYEIQRFQRRPGPNEQMSVPTPWGYYNVVKRFHYSSQSGAHWYVLQHDSFR